VATHDPVLTILQELNEDDFPTAEYDIAPLALAHEAAHDPISGIRRSCPTLSNEVGPLPNEPEEDALYRCFGCGARVLSPIVPVGSLEGFHLETRHLHVLGLMDGETAICELLEKSDLPRHETLCVLEELLILEVVD
jgi:hypothetical protein